MRAPSTGRGPAPPRAGRPPAVYCGALLLVTALVALLPAMPLADDTAVAVSWVVQALSAAVAAAVLLTRAGVHEDSRRAWVWAGRAVVCWTGGQTVLTVDLLLGDSASRPWAADVCFLGAVVSALAAALSTPRIVVHSAGVRSWLDGGITASSILLATWLYLGPTFGAGVGSTDGVLALAYPLVDCLIVTVLVDSAVRAAREQAVALGTAALGILVLAATNLEAFRLAQAGPVVGPQWIDAGFVLSIGLVAVGALLQPHVTSEPRSLRLVSRVQLALPYSALPLVLLLVVVRPEALGHGPALLLCGVAALLLARQWIAVSGSARLAEQLVARARRYEALVHGATDVTLLLDEDGHVRYASPSVARVLDRSPEQLRGASLLDLVDPSDRASAAEVLLRARGRRATSALLQMAHPDGPRLLDARLSDLREDPEVGGLVLNAHDVTDRWAAEAALSDSERNLRRIVETAQEGIWATDAVGTTTLLNPEAERVLGLDADQVVGRSAQEVLEPMLDPEQRRELAGHVAERQGGGIARFTTVLRRADGSQVHLQVSSSPLFDAAGALDGSLTMIADITDRVALERRLKEDARTDALTGLGNRVDLLEHAGRMLAEDAAPVLVYCDLDGFKAVNDTWGHSEGDAVLREVAQRLQSCTRSRDVLARLGGDEFALLVHGGEGAAGAVAQRVLTALREPVASGGRSHHVGVSIGVASARPGDDADALLRNADLAMYQAKSDGRGRVRWYEPVMHAVVRTRTQLEDGLWRAVAREELELLYQPVVDLQTGRCVGAEALLRWNSLELGRVMPDVFIPVAEETGAIVPIGRWVLEEACREAATWSAPGAPLTLSVNIAPRQLLDDGLQHDLAAALRDSGLDADRLLLEVTERSLLAGDLTRRALRGLRDTGARLALDDFGTGYSSVSHLRDHPVDVLKLDQSYVAQVLDETRSGQLVAAVLGFSRQLGISSTAEGVETAEQAAVLRTRGCDYAQGYLFARPLTGPAFQQWLAVNAAVPQQRSGEGPDEVVLPDVPSPRS